MHVKLYGQHDVGLLWSKGQEEIARSHRVALATIYTMYYYLHIKYDSITNLREHLEHVWNTYVLHFEFLSFLN